MGAITLKIEVTVEDGIGIERLDTAMRVERLAERIRSEVNKISNVSAFKFTTERTDG